MEKASIIVLLWQALFIFVTLSTPDIDSENT